MIADRDLLKLAAKAAGIRLHVWGAKGAENFADLDAPETGGRWNPLTDDGDALRLAVKLHLMVDVDAIGEPISRVIATGIFENELHGADPCAATRRAIVRAAASIGAKP